MSCLAEVDFLSLISLGDERSDVNFKVFFINIFIESNIPPILKSKDPKFFYSRLILRFGYRNRNRRKIGRKR